MSADELAYPFTPRSNRHLRPGQYWAIPLTTGGYAAGRVLAVPAFGPKDRVGVVVGLIDWSGDHEPTEEDLAGRGVLLQALSRFEAIANSGGQVLGFRPLEIDGIAPIDPTDLSVGSVHLVSGWRAFINHAEKVFGAN